MARLVEYKEVFDKAMQDEELRAEYEALKPEFELAKKLIDAKIKSGLTGTEIADKMGIKQPNLSRFEKALFNGENFKFDTLIKYAKALGLKELKINF